MSVAATPDKRTWLGRLRSGLARSTQSLNAGLAGVLSRNRLDRQTLEELEELLIAADLGVATAAQLTAKLAEGRFDREITRAEVCRALADEISAILEPVARPLILEARAPHVILVAGVNGTGKTTTIGKLAHRFAGEGKRVVVAACDTFRAAAIDQLMIWGARAGAEVIAGAPGADAAGVAFDAFEAARAQAADVLLIDTAGRLQNKAGLMAELAKISRVLKKIDATAPHSSLLVLDATTGQNVHSQVEIFQHSCALSGLIMNKLDGTARGGVLVALAGRFALPVHALGVGEGIEDLQPFEARAFAEALLGIGDEAVLS